MDKTSLIYGNVMPKSVCKKANKSKIKYLRKFGDDSKVNYCFKAEINNIIGESLGVSNLVLSDKQELVLPKNAIIIGNIRMGFGHYRIAMAMASCAKALGYKPFWFDLNSYQNTTCGKIINHNNKLYSLGSKLSQTNKLFNKLIWEPMNSEGFRKLSYNAVDQKIAELMTPLFKNIPIPTPYIATHAWTSQAAIHAGMTSVVNAIPDNWPMALHLSEGATHTVQTQSAYLGYKALRGMDKTRTLKTMPDGTLFNVGHYVDHEIVSNLESDTQHRLERINSNKAKRYLLSVGGAGAQKSIFVNIIKKLLPEIEQNKAVLFVNVGDHLNVLKELEKEIPVLKEATKHFDNFTETEKFSNDILTANTSGIHTFYNKNIFAAVYSSNLLMRASDVLITKPSEFSFYPIPKLLIKRVGGHEMWGAIRSQEVGDGTYECDTNKEICDMLDLLQNDNEVLTNMCNNILKNNASGLYNGAYEVVKLATKAR